MNQLLQAEFAKILADNTAASQAVETVLYAAASVAGPLQPVIDAYKVYLASGRKPYAKEELAALCQRVELCTANGLPASLIDELYHASPA